MGGGGQENWEMLLYVFLLFVRYTFKNKTHIMTRIQPADSPDDPLFGPGGGPDFGHACLLVNSKSWNMNLLWVYTVYLFTYIINSISKLYAAGNFQPYGYIFRCI